jgi:hypothetical protein
MDVATVNFQGWQWRGEVVNRPIVRFHWHASGMFRRNFVPQDLHTHIAKCAHMAMWVFRTCKMGHMAKCARSLAEFTPQLNPSYVKHRHGLAGQRDSLLA